MHDETVAHLDLTGCSMPYDFFDRIIKALNLGVCSHNWDAIYDFGWSNSTVEKVYITGESTITAPMRDYLPILHEALDRINEERQNLFGTSLTYVILN